MRWSLHKILGLILCSILHSNCNSRHSFSIDDTEEGIGIIENGKKVLFYQLKPKDASGKYERAGYVHPLYDLNENILTEDGPEDHPYHRGVFWSWTQIKVEDSLVANGWISENIAYVPEQYHISPKKDRAVIQTTFIWKQLNGPDTLQNLIKETTVLTIHSTRGNYRLLDFDITLQPLTAGISIGGAPNEKEYGGFCIRLKLPNDIRFYSVDTALQATETPVSAGPWMNFSGEFNPRGSQPGVALFTPTPYPGPQQSWILRSKNSMQNIVFPGRKTQVLPKEGWRLRYRIVIYEQPMPGDDLNVLYEEYITDADSNKTQKR